MPVGRFVLSISRAALPTRIAATIPPLMPLTAHQRLARLNRRRIAAAAPARVDSGRWKGVYVAVHPDAPRGSVVARLTIKREDWTREWPLLLRQIEADSLPVLKRDASGDVLAATLRLAGTDVCVIVKRPRHKFWYRSLLAPLRRTRARRLFDKTLWLVARRLPVEPPLLLMQQSRMGRAVEGIALFERVAGTTLDSVDLDALTRPQRDALFTRCGRILRRIEQTGLTHTDAKSTNWIVIPPAPATPQTDAPAGKSGAPGPLPAHPAVETPPGTKHAEPLPAPVLIDAYGIRKWNIFLQLFGIRRLLRAMRHHPQYTPADSRALCLGFAPDASLLEAVEQSREEAK